MATYKPRIVFADTNVLFGALTRDLILSLSLGTEVEVHWTPQVIDELRRHLNAYFAKTNPEDGEFRVNGLIANMNASFATALIHLRDDLEIGDGWPDPDDEHVIRGALSAGADWIITDNLSDFPSELMRPLGLGAITADQYLEMLFNHYSVKVLTALDLWIASRSRPVHTRESLLVRLREVGMTGFAERLRVAWATL